MQIEILSPTQGQILPPVEWNYIQLKEELSEALKKYEGRVYTEDDIAVAKKDRASLNKLAGAIDSKRKEMKSRYLAPYEEFEGQAKELADLVKEQSKAIDTQIKVYDDARKAEKLEKIKAIYIDHIGDLAALIPYERLHNDRWLNVTTSLSTIEKNLCEQIEMIQSDFKVITDLDVDWVEQLKDKYLQTFDLRTVLKENIRLQEQAVKIAEFEMQQKQAQEQVREETSIQIPTEQSLEQPAELIEISFRIRVTESQLHALKVVMKDNGIKPERC